LETFVKSLHTNPESIKMHLTYGTPWQEVGRLAKHLKIDLIAMGTIGRSGIKGLLLGNTAEKILDTSDCSILTVKPNDFVSPVTPGFGPLYPDQANVTAEVKPTEEA
jgi:universal stress protein E